MSAERRYFDSGRVLFRVGDRVRFRVTAREQGTGRVAAVDRTGLVRLTDGTRVPFYAIRERVA